MRHLHLSYKVKQKELHATLQIYHPLLLLASEPRVPRRHEDPSFASALDFLCDFGSNGTSLVPRLAICTKERIPKLLNHLLGSNGGRLPRT